MLKLPGSQINAGARLVQKWWQSFCGFLFPSETDTWLAVLRIGLGLQVVVYALFLRDDWHYLFASSGKGLVGREVGEAITAFDSPLIPTFSWLVAFGRNLDAHSPSNMEANTTSLSRADSPSEAQCFEGRSCYVSSLYITVAACCLALVLSIWAGWRDRQRSLSVGLARKTAPTEVVWEQDEDE